MKFYPYTKKGEGADNVLTMLKGGTKDFEVVSTQELEVVAILCRWGEEGFHPLKGGCKKYNPVLRGGGCKRFWTRDDQLPTASRGIDACLCISSEIHIFSNRSLSEIVTCYPNTDTKELTDNLYYLSMPVVD